MKIIHGEIFHYMHEIVFFLFVAGGLLLITELAFRYGRRSARKHQEDFSSQASTFGSTMLGLLALLLGFAFAMALGRFDTRKELLLAEGNDIQTAYLRADMLPLTQRANIKRLFGEYTALRLEYYHPGTLAADMQGVVERTLRIQQDMWAEAMAALRMSNNVEPGYSNSQVLTFIASLNAIFEDQAKRTIARGNHIPEAILWLLIFVAAGALATMAYSLGLKNAYFFLPRFVLVLAVASVLSIILDLDRPIRGLIQMDQQEMREIHRAIRQDIEASTKAP